ncbi:NAD(P)/FAD-dependent oxidoreductase [Falsirhodobacter sp. 20TX0035]|uniref:NAD(P)/FAD-dependent oxidoreductase n=1 Tax=Falsirhodobacter sp. 20TX0035 TaxID=3022019 RepID=UPI00232EF209|nr:NAD(P)/FAD-dependent oxidoreductase [Falsirhodobacter sp. 20TX0035]MDB6454251.1 NAD(P)/FAD-dependent oxidoreductase [Falsirhodobacter sp. 20TX0035]
MTYDVIILGGSFAGLSAAMQLARARRSVAVVDNGRPRNRFAATSHGFPGQDGRSPVAIRSDLPAELAAYSTASLLDGAATRIVREDEHFRITLGDGTEHAAQRVVLAYGMRDDLPDLPGLVERWGVSVLHCPYCHGHELCQQPVGVLGRDAGSFHQAMLLPDWGPTTLFTQGFFELPTDHVEALTARGVTIECEPVVALVGDAPALRAVELRDGRRVALAGLFLATRTAPACDLAERLGCVLQDGPTGPFVTVDAMQATSVPGVFAAGDLASPVPNAVRAAAAGVMAGSAAHRSLIFDPHLSGGRNAG